MIVEDSDLQWLRDTFPGLSYDPNTRMVSGDLDFCARYDGAGERLRIEGAERAPTVLESGARLCDVFAVRIELDMVADSAIDWPVVYEVGGRCASIAEARKIPAQDLHINFDGSCCLGIQVDPGPNSLECFINDLVVPFFYRVAYAERFDIARAQDDLWGEYRHGADGLRDRLREISSARMGRNSPCPCGSGRKYKVCCLELKGDRLRSLTDRLETMPSVGDPRRYGESRAARRRRSRQR